MNSYVNLADKLIDFANVDWSGRESQRNSCRYGVEMLISVIVNFGLVLITGLLLGIIKEVLIYLIAWGSLRLFSGGRHATNHRNCIILYITVMVITIFTCKYGVANVDTKNLEVVMFAVAFIINILYAGREQTKLERKNKFKYITLMVLAIQFVIVMTGNTSIITGAVVAQSMFVIPFHYSRRKLKV